MVLSKKQMTEEDIKLQFITPAILAKWNVQNITMETPVKQNVKFTDGKINIKGNIVSREKPKKADYILYINSGTPIAIVEAKDNNHSISHGLQQAKTYAEMLDVPFAFSSNGDGFAEHDYITGLEKQFSMDQFPSPQELIERFTAGKSITPVEQKVIDEPFYTGQNTYPPRYYQRNAVNRTLSAIAENPEVVVPEQPEPPAEKPQDIRYKIVWGDTLWDISEAYYKNPWRYKSLAKYNGIRNPDYIISGTWINIPAE